MVRSVHEKPTEAAGPTGAMESSSDSELNEDDKVLASLGYQPVFKRHFSTWSLFSFALSISGLFGTVSTTFSYGLYAGGAASAVWCWLIGVSAIIPLVGRVWSEGAGALCLALSIAEVSSAYPTSGGMYFTLKYLAPPKYTPIIAWFVGWLNLIGQICGSASSVYGAAQMLLAAVSIGSDFTYYPTQGHVIGVMAALSVFHGAINSLSTNWLHKLARGYAIFHIAILVACWITLLVLQRNDLHTAKYTFTHVEPASGWTPTGFSFLFGFLSVSWTMTDYDAAAHIAEEVKDPARVVPKAIASALTFTYLIGWVYTVILVLAMGDPSELLASPIGQPVVQLFYNVMGKHASLFYTSCAFIVMNLVCITALQAGSRTLWSFARDEMIPGAKVWNKIWKRTDTPVLAVWFYVFMCVAINLIGLGSYITISAIFNVCAIALDWSYCIPIICKLVFGRFEPGPWNLGKFSKPLNIYACCWTAFVSIIFLFPSYFPVDKENMNYAVVILGFIGILATAYWIIHGRTYYVGPRVTAHVYNGGVVPAESEDEKADPEKSSAGPRAQPAA